MSTIVAITFTGATDSQELGKDTSDIDNFNDVFGNLNRYVFHVLPWERVRVPLRHLSEICSEDWKGLSLERAARGLSIVFLHPGFT
jgi:hypothetical protein